MKRRFENRLLHHRRRQAAELDLHPIRSFRWVLTCSGVVCIHSTPFVVIDLRLLQDHNSIMIPETLSREKVARLIVSQMHNYATRDKIAQELNAAANIPQERVVTIWEQLQLECPSFFQQYHLRQLVREQDKVFCSMMRDRYLLLQTIKTAMQARNFPNVEELVQAVVDKAQRVGDLAQEIINLNREVYDAPNRDWTALEDARPDPLHEYGKGRVAWQQLQYNSTITGFAYLLRGHAIELGEQAQEVAETSVTLVSQAQDINVQAQLINDRQELFDAQAVQIAQEAQQLAQLQADMAAAAAEQENDAHSIVIDGST